MIALPSYIDPELFISEWPKDVIPKDAKVFVFVDPGFDDQSCEIKGFVDHKTGVIHVQELRTFAAK